MVCAHPINLCNSLGSGLSDPIPLYCMQQEPWLESAINFPFCELHCLGGLLSSHSGIQTSGITISGLSKPFAQAILRKSSFCLTRRSNQRPWPHSGFLSLLSLYPAQQKILFLPFKIHVEYRKTIIILWNNYIPIKFLIIVIHTFNCLLPFKWMFSNCGAGEDSWEFFGQKGDQTSQF